MLLVLRSYHELVLYVTDNHKIFKGIITETLRQHITTASIVCKQALRILYNNIQGSTRNINQIKW